MLEVNMRPMAIPPLVNGMAGDRLFTPTGVWEHNGSTWIEATETPFNGNNPCAEITIHYDIYGGK